MLAENGEGHEELEEIRSMFSALARLAPPGDIAILEGSASWGTKVEESLDLGAPAV